MAKNNNLKDFLTDVADAIREKKGISEAINPQDFSAEIASIESGGGGAVAASAVAPKDVNLRDYDGRILYAYTKAQFLKMSELPALPEQKGLISEGWNWSIESAKTYVEKYGKLEIGANYITDDNKTRLYITIAAEGRMDVPLYFYQSMANGVTIDWGDGSATETIEAADKVRASHTYAQVGSYCITLDPAEGCRWYPGGQSATDSIMGKNTPAAYGSMLRRVELGGNMDNSIYTYCFNSCYSLESVSMPNYIKSVSAYAFKNCYSLKSLVIAGSGVGRETFMSCYSLESVSIGESLSTTIDYAAFKSCYSLSVVTIPSTVTTLGSDVFYQCYSLSTVVIPDGIKQMAISAFYQCSSLVSLVMPQLTKIESNAFYYCNSLAFLDFSKQASVPALSNINALNNVASDCQIIVPYQLYDAWIVASNWTSYSDKIVRNVTATECLSLSITASDVRFGNIDEATVTWTAVVNGVLLDGSRVEGITINGKEMVHIGKNKTAESVAKEIAYEYLGVTATATITQGAYLDNAVVCKYAPTTTTSTTNLMSSSFSNFSTYIGDTMFVDGEEVARAASYKFSSLGEHTVVFKVADGASITNLYRMFYNTCGLMTEADLSALDMSGVTSTSSSGGTAYMFYGCASLRKITLPSTVAYLGYYMFYGCKKVTSLTIEALTAPNTYGSSTWGESSSYIGYTNRDLGINKFYVPAGATDYTAARFGLLYNVAYCGFTLEYLDE